MLSMRWELTFWLSQPMSIVSILRTILLKVFIEREHDHFAPKSRCLDKRWYEKVWKLALPYQNTVLIWSLSFKTFSHILCTDIGQQGSTLFFYKLPTIAALHSQDFQKWAVRGPMKNFDLHCCMLVSYSSSSSASSNLGSWCSSWMQTHSKLIRKCWLYSAIKV